MMQQELNVSINLVWSRVTLHGVSLMQVKEWSAQRRGQRGSSYHFEPTRWVGMQSDSWFAWSPAHYRANDTKSIFVPVELDDSCQDSQWTFSACIVKLFSGISFHLLKGNFLKATAKSYAWGERDGGMYTDCWSLMDSQCHPVVAWTDDVAVLGIYKGYKKWRRLLVLKQL